MKLAEFPTMADYNDCVASSAVASYLASNYWFYIGLTYDNGDMTDNWCGTHTPAPPGMIGATYYTAPMCGVRNLFVATPTGIQNIPWTNAMDYYICM